MTAKDTPTTAASVPGDALMLYERAVELAAQPAPVESVAQGGEEGVGYGIIDPDYARIFTIARVLCWSEGYALTMHGSFTRDLDLVAVPWTDRAREPEHLARRVLEACGLKDSHSNPGEKPHGRLVWTMRLPDFGDPRFVDFSIVPPTPTPATGSGGEASCSEIPNGWVAVPREPTLGMLLAAAKHDYYGEKDPTWRSLYVNMIAAVPSRAAES